MPINKQALKSRIENMFWLPDNWDGFGSPSISRKCFDISVKLVDCIKEDVEVKVFVGAKVAGSVYFEFKKNNRIIELLVNPSGILEYNEVDSITYKHIRSGGWMARPEIINVILGEL